MEQAVPARMQGGEARPDCVTGMPNQAVCAAECEGCLPLLPSPVKIQILLPYSYVSYGTNSGGGYHYCKNNRVSINRQYKSMLWFKVCIAD